MSKPLRSLRLSPKSDYARFTGNRGEIFYDPVNDTLRVFNSTTVGGEVMATRSWVLANSSDFTVDSLRSNNDINIDINLADSTLRRWRFGEDGSLTLPIGVSIDDNVDPLYPKIIADSGKLFSIQGQGSTGSAAMAWSLNPNTDTQYAAVGVNQGGGDNLAKVVLTAGNTTATLKVWKFDETGDLTFPDATVQTTAFTGIPGPYADDEAATLAGVALGSPYHKTGTNGQVFVRLTSPT
jgi:hypothetical protein